MPSSSYRFSRMSAITWPQKDVSLARPGAHPGPTLPGSTYLADVLAHILDDHLVSRNGLHGKQAPVVNVALAEFQLFLPELGEGARGGVRPGLGSYSARLPWPGPTLTLSWLNLSRSLSQLPVKEDNRRRCSERRSEPARVEACGCAGMLMPCEQQDAGQTGTAAAAHILGPEATPP